MSGLENIIARIEAENEAQCEAVAAEAADRAAQIVAAADTEGRETVRAAAAEAQKQAGQMVARAKSAGALAARRALLAAKVELVDEVLAEAKQTLASLPADRYFETLRALAVKNKQAGEGVLFFGEKDLARLPADFAGTLGAGISVSETPAPISDGFLLKYGDIEINCTLDALFAAARDPLKAGAGERLFG